jgi:hypothetical protein
MIFKAIAALVPLALALQSSTAHAAPVVCKVWVNAATAETDSVGKSVVLAVKERLAKSELFDLVDEGEAQLELGIVTLPVGGPGVQSAMAINVIVGEKSPSPFRWGYQLAGSLGLKTCGRDVVDTCAQGLISNLDQRLEAHREVFCGGVLARDQDEPVGGLGILAGPSPSPDQR